MPVANVAYNDVFVIHKRVDIDRVWYSLQSFLIAFANISKIFWIKKQTNRIKHENKGVRCLL